MTHCQMSACFELKCATVKFPKDKVTSPEIPVSVHSRQSNLISDDFRHKSCDRSSEQHLPPKTLKPPHPQH